MRSVARAGVAFALATISACSTYQAKPVSPVENAQALASRTLDNERLHRFVTAALSLHAETALPGTWNLQTLSLAAVYYHPELDIARARLAGALAAIKTARQIPNPSLDLGLTYNATMTTPSPWAVGSMISFIVETFGKRRYRTAEAEYLADAARDDLATATWQVRSRVREALLQLWIARERLSRAEQRLDEQETLVRLIEHRFDLGEASSLDVTRERINRNQARLAIRDVERQGAEARARLAQALGIPLLALQSATISLRDFEAPPHAPDASTGELRTRALTTRSDIHALLAEYQAAQSALQLQISRQFPDMRLGPGYTYDQGDHKYELGVRSELPVFNQNQGPIAQAAAHREEIGARFTALQARVIAAIDAATTSYRSASEALGTADTVLSEARRRLKGIGRGFEAGLLDRPTLVGAQIEVATAELSRLDALLAQRIGLGLLEDALRTPLFRAKDEIPVEERNPRIASERPR